jgi:hypothetical protein
MFKLIGGFVVCGFALYGLVTFVEQHKSAVAARNDGPSEGTVAPAPDADPSAADSGKCVSPDESGAATATA